MERQAIALKTAVLSADCADDADKKGFESGRAFTRQAKPVPGSNPGICAPFICAIGATCGSLSSRVRDYCCANPARRSRSVKSSGVAWMRWAEA